MFPVAFEQSQSGWVARGPGYRILLERGGAELAASEGRGHDSALRMEVVGARRDPAALPEIEVPGHRNYLMGSDPARWRTHVPLWERVRFRGVLDGVDVVYRGGGHRFEYDLAIAPGADAAAIEISFTGADGIRFDESGGLIMPTAAGDAIQHRPVAYQTIRGVRHEVTAKFRLKGTRVGFDLGDYDRSEPLIIDPVIDYATWFPGSVTTVAVDSTGAAYIAGQVNGGSVLPVTYNAYQKATPGSQAAETNFQLLYHLYVAKFSPDGSSLVYCTYLGGSGTDTAVALALDSSGNVVVGGITGSTDYPVTPGAYMTRNPGAYPISFVSKLSADGSQLLWSTLLPALGLTDVGLNGDGDVFALCSPLSRAVVTTPNAITTGDAYRWLGELDPAGARLVYATYVPGLQATSLSGGMAMRQDGTVWVGGTAPGINALATEACPATGLSPTPAAVVGIDPAGSKVIASLQIGGSLQTSGTGLQFDASGDLYLSGATCSPDFPGIDTSLVRFGNGINYAVAGFVVKLAAASDSPLWTVTTRGWPIQAAVDPSGNVAVLEPFNPAEYLHYYDASGNLLWTTQYTGPQGPALTMDSQGRIYVGSNAGGTSNAWESGQAYYNPYENNLPAQGLMRILPSGGSLAVFPQAVTEDAYTWGQAVSVFSTGGATLGAPFTVSTDTPWLQLVIKEEGNPVSPPGIATPLPNWPGTAFATISVDLDPTLPPGRYDGSFTVSSPTLTNSPVTVQVHAVMSNQFSPTIVMPSQIAIVDNYSVTSLLSYLPGIQSYQQYLLTVASSTPWIVPASNGEDAAVDGTALPAGLSTGHVTIAVAGDPGSPYAVTVFVIEGTQGNLWNGVASNLVAGPAILSFLAQAGDAPKHATVGIWQKAAYRTDFAAASEATWLTVSPPAGSAPGVLSVTADPGGLEPGSYTTHVDITSKQSANGGVRIPVTLTVQADVPFNVDPAAVAVRQTPVITPMPFTLSSAQQMTYVANTGNRTTGLTSVLSCSNGSGLTGSTPGQVSIQLAPCAYSPSGWGDLTFTTSNNDVREVPVAVMPYALYPLISTGGIVNGATFGFGPVAPGSIVAVFGIDLANSVSSNSAPLPFPRMPDIALNLFPAPNFDYPGVFYESAGQWNIQLPYALTPGTYWLQIGGSPFAVFTVAAVAPYVFTWGANHGSILNADNSLNTPARPAAAGSSIQVYLTGQGAVSPPVSTGMAAPPSPLSYVVAATTATIDGAPASVAFAGLAPGFVGLCQVNVGIPSGLPAGEHNLVIAIGGIKANQVVFDAN